MSTFRVILTFDAADPRRPQEFLQQQLLPKLLDLDVLTSKIKVVDPPNPASPAAQMDDQQTLDIP